MEQNPDERIFACPFTNVPDDHVVPVYQDPDQLDLLCVPSASRLYRINALSLTINTNVVDDKENVPKKRNADEYLTSPDLKRNG